MLHVSLQELKHCANKVRLVIGVRNWIIMRQITYFGFVVTVVQLCSAISTNLSINTSTANNNENLYCGCESCTDDVWNTIAQGHSCGDRITYLESTMSSLYPTTALACYRVASIEFPMECGGCNPEVCIDDVVEMSNNTPEYYCGCLTCTEDEWKANAGDGLSCEAKVRWAQVNTQHYQLEIDACKLISIQFPLSCGKLCNPTTCTRTIDTTTNTDQNFPTPPPIIIIVDTPPTQTPKIYERNAPIRIDNDAPDSTSQKTDIPSLFGPNVWIMDSFTMTTAEIQGAFDDIYNQQVHNEMGTERCAIFFLPGEYGTVTDPLYLKMGYYTEVAGLGIHPGDVIINGKIEIYNRCFVPDQYQQGKFIPFHGDSGMCFALNNFWRSLSNLSINIVSNNQDECRKTAMFWAVSQASSMRRVDIRGGDVSLMDYCTHPAYASGGFISNSRAGKIISGSQQQFISRNMDINEWDGSVWNIMFMGVNGAPNGSDYPNPPFTTFETTPLSREKPYIFIDEGTYYVRVSNAAKDTNGVSWSDEQTVPMEEMYPISNFFIVNPETLVDEINSALSIGKHVLFLPGVYDISETITVEKAGTVLLGIGHATLTSINGVPTMKVADEPGIIIAGLTFDAGEMETNVLLQMGPTGSTVSGDASNPTTLADVYFRLGGPHIGKAQTCLEVNSNNILMDHIWVWRADHGIEDFDTTDGFEGDNERWRTNTGRNGVIVNGANVTAIGLFVEHYQEHNLIWNGEDGKVYFFQSELPYDPPTQEEWTNLDGALGWSGYKVSDSISRHELWAGGVYSYNRNNPFIQTDNGFETPPPGNGISMNRLFTRNLSGPGIMNAVHNGMGQKAEETNPGPHYLL